METLQNKTTETILKNSPCYNPYSFLGKDVENLIFFKDGNVIAKKRWFGSNNDYPTLVLPFELKRKNVIDLNANKSFYSTIKTGYEKGKIEIYIHADSVNLKELGESVYYDNENETTYYNNFSIEVKASQSKLRKDDSYNGYSYYNTDIELTVIPFTTYSRNVKKEKLINDEQLKKDINTLCNVGISIYDLQRILQHYSITKL